MDGPSDSDADARKKVFKLLKDIRVAMMATRDENGRMRSRPMATQEQESDGDLWFFTWADSRKVDELRRNPEVMLGYADPAHQNYVSVVGTAEVVRDAALAKSLWSEPMRAWFAKGPEDPNLAMVKVRIESAEYWDSPSSTMVHAYGYLKALTTGKPAKGGGENEAVSFA